MPSRLRDFLLGWSEYCRLDRIGPVRQHPPQGCLPPSPAWRGRKSARFRRIPRSCPAPTSALWYPAQTTPLS
jgi:hypothetical protein